MLKNLKGFPVCVGWCEDDVTIPYETHLAFKKCVPGLVFHSYPIGEHRIVREFGADVVAFLGAPSVAADAPPPPPCSPPPSL